MEEEYRRGVLGERRGGRAFGSSYWYRGFGPPGSNSCLPGCFHICFSLTFNCDGYRFVVVNSSVGRRIMRGVLTAKAAARKSRIRAGCPLPCTWPALTHRPSHHFVPAKRSSDEATCWFNPAAGDSLSVRTGGFQSNRATHGYCHGCERLRSSKRQGDGGEHGHRCRPGISH
ncbi:MAG: hypothetical protein IANPNBLG_03743 [Bryobacteraceae bacterium]|nr:hypothetical protein [Bryobacteraceae bacterium]